MLRVFPCPVRTKWGWCGACYEAIRCGRTSCVAAEADRKKAQRKEHSLMFVKRSTVKPGEEVVANHLDGVLSVACLPAMVEYMTLETYEDGASRETATLLVFTESGSWKACLNDRQEERSAWAAGSTLVQCLEALEASLAEGTADWRRSAKRRK